MLKIPKSRAVVKPIFGGSKGCGGAIEDILAKGPRSITTIAAAVGILRCRLVMYILSCLSYKVKKADTITYDSVTLYNLLGT